MEIAYFDPLGRAWKRMQQVLFSPFDGKKFLVIGFTAWLAGVFENGNGGASSSWTEDRESISDWGGGAADWLAATGAAILVLFVLLAIVILILAFLWLSSRFKFIFLDNLVRNEGAVKVPWKQYGACGNSLFLWRIGFWVVTMILGGGIVLAGAAVTGVAAGVGLEEVSWMTIAAFLATLLALVVLPAAYVSLFLDSFIVPIMYRYEVTTSEAWRRFLPLLRDHLFYFLAYGIFFLVLNLLVVSFMVLVGLFTCCVGFVLLALPYVGTVFTLPIWVTFRAFSVEYLGQFDPELALFPAMPPAQPPAPPPPPPPTT
jgi:hypothetical protein